VTGDATLGGVLRLTSAGAAGAGSYRLVTAAGATTGAFASVAVQGIDNAALHQVVTTEAGVTRVDLFRLAATAETIPATVAFGNVRRGLDLTSTLTFTNAAAADGFSEQLVGTATGQGSGFAAVAAGAPGVVTFSLDRSTVGAKVGASTVSIESVGVGGFANTVLRAGTVALSANVYDLASATLGATSLTLGNVRVAGTAGFDVTNTVVTDAAFQDSLDVVATAANGKLTFANPARLAAGATGTVTLTAATAGVLDASVAVGLTSNANGLAGLTNVAVTAPGNILAGQTRSVGVAIGDAGSLAGTIVLGLSSNANGVADLQGRTFADHTVTVTGAAYDLAQATVAPALTLGNVRVGAANPLAVTNTVFLSATYQDSLDVVATSANAKLGFANPAKIDAGLSGDVAVTAVAAGSLAGNIALALTSNANGLAGLTNEALVGQSVAVTGAAYDLARATLASGTLAMGNVRLGQSVAMGVTNTATTDAAFQDSLDVLATSANGSLTVVSPANIAAGLSGNVTVATNLAGAIAGTVNLGLASNANGVVGLDNAALAGQSFAVTGAAFDYAVATVAPTLDLGNLRVGANRALNVANTVTTSAAYQ
ncbi:MAG: choice-of-anchor D domain-containing protein, partial [Sphingomonadaceae bacterium]|nr:choice-of-anchor D domain-containing protein [Sphingomonadaceae bacterium]